MRPRDTVGTASRSRHTALVGMVARVEVDMVARVEVDMVVGVDTVVDTTRADMVLEVATGAAGTARADMVGAAGTTRQAGSTRQVGTTRRPWLRQWAAVRGSSTGMTLEGRIITTHRAGSPSGTNHLVCRV